MQAPNEVPENLIRKAANAFSRGSSWKTIASEVKHESNAVRNWSEEYPAIWKDECGKAEEQIQRETAAEVKHILRQLLRSDDERIRCNAIQLLLRLHGENQRHALRAAQAGIEVSQVSQ